MSDTRPARRAALITPSDSVDISGVGETRGIHCNVGGTVRVVFADAGTTTTDLVLVDGVTYPFSVKRVYSTGTNPSVQLVALFG